MAEPVKTTSTHSGQLPIGPDGKPLKPCCACPETKKARDQLNELNHYLLPSLIVNKQYISGVRITNTYIKLVFGRDRIRGGDGEAKGEKKGIKCI
ncbi:hypothetical protein VTP01DRAFT_442 [Rhizomucor pusillus]|uniref:uncharacterized protein n=1 Tax=Rhizomucor pusillus TaxID=4840 RepID=UPI003744224B